ncbi:DoxX family protein [Streptomyces sp. NBC_01264]|uniref:DoxX family protein n=1 Tax=Streptomyces sp. NBC_01264 TaxID=2903804 RepID=UPI00224D88F3|nr:DoxX family protein [Streptomyces sp. NBC_01264]MCX4776613.1 DoxX family protein [Streptomyces sp. NBC_01264]
MPHLSRPGDDHLLGLFRIATGFLLACHGAAKLSGFFGDDPVPVGLWPYWWAGLIELGGGALVATGLLTRPAALLCSGTMAYAYFTEHQPHGLLPLQNDGESAALYCWAFLTLAVLAPTALSLPAARRHLIAARGTKAPLSGPAGA